MKFCFGDIVVVEGNLIGVVVKSWCRSLMGSEENPVVCALIQQDFELSRVRDGAVYGTA